MELYKHQKVALKKALKYDKFALFMDFGTGKTLTALHWLREKGAFPALVVCPKSVIPHWYRQCNDLKPVVRTPNNSSMDWGQADVNCINYEQLQRIEQRTGLFKSVVFDESTYIKNPIAKRSKHARKIAKNKKHVLLLTALPAPHHFDDLFSQFQSLDPNVLGNNYWTFINYYYTDIRRYHKFDLIPKVWTELDEGQLKVKYFMARRKGFPVRMLVDSRRAELLKKIKTVSIVIDKKVLDLPDKTVIRIPLIPTVEQARAFIPAEKVEDTLKGFVICQRVASGFDGEWAIQSAKLNALAEMRESLGDEKLLVWAHYRADIARISQYFGDKCSHIHGDTKDRDSILQNFLNGPIVNTLVCQQRAFGIGTNITPVRYAVYYSNSFNYEDRVQSEDRIHRIGQTERVFIFDLLVHPTDGALLNAYSRGQSIQDYLKGSE